MLTDTEASSLQRAFSVLPEATVRAIGAASQTVTMAKGSRVYGPGQAPQAYLMLLEGTVRVQQISETGREIVLFRVTAGESCPLTTTCLIGGQDYSAEAIAETDVKAVVLAKAAFDRLIADSGTFRRFVFGAFTARLSELFQVIEDVAFARIDIRLANKLLALADATGTLHSTQHQLAAELGSAREVISRQLGEFQRRGWVEVSRGAVRLLDRGALRRLAGAAAGGDEADTRRAR